ncbi:hypothetical protein B296_00032203 [Ensete ventricosum]|uniref:Uncharacterized protein n=1 Tax=Ensete ventricosum TaxID=4639 RepID=A0A426YFC2_ENSVE|nr:hypothetical protein B296_00032203 [Ensete ventricosum]
MTVGFMISLVGLVGDFGASTINKVMVALGNLVTAYRREGCEAIMEVDDIPTSIMAIEVNRCGRGSSLYMPCSCSTSTTPQNRSISTVANKDEATGDILGHDGDNG